jgi:hypothetical protein
MLINVDGSGVVPILPKGALTIFALIKLLARSAGHELHAPRNHVSTSVLQQQMNMVGRHRIVEHGKSEPLLCLEEPVEVPAPVACDFEEEYLSVAAMSYVPDVSRQEMAVGARHRSRLDGDDGEKGSGVFSADR